MAGRCSHNAILCSGPNFLASMIAVNNPAGPPPQIKLSYSALGNLFVASAVPEFSVEDICDKADSFVVLGKDALGAEYALETLKSNDDKISWNTSTANTLLENPIVWCINYE